MDDSSVVCIVLSGLICMNNSKRALVEAWAKGQAKTKQETLKGQTRLPQIFVKLNEPSFDI